MAKAKPQRAPKNPPPPCAPVEPPGPSAWLAPALIAAAVALVYAPILRFGFLNYDDGMNFTDNPGFRGLDPAHLRWILAGSHGLLGNYEPVNWLVQALNWTIWGMDPKGFHLSSLVLHAGVALGFYALALRLLGLAYPCASRFEREACSALAALLFALHPLRVEVVAWASAQHHSIAGIFALACAWAYLKAREKDGAWSPASLAFFALSLLSFPIAMGLPAALFALDVFPLGRWSGARRDGGGQSFWALALEKWPYGVIAAALGAVELSARRSQQMVMTMDQHGPLARVAQAFYGLCYYLFKSVLPFGLYPIHPIHGELKLWDWPYVVCAPLVLAAAWALVRRARRRPAPVAAAAWYLFLLGPLLGLNQAGPQLVADRYCYLPSLGWSLLAGAAPLWLAGEGGERRVRFWGAAAALAAILAALAVQARSTMAPWKDSESLWTWELSKDADVPIAHNNLGLLLADKGRHEEAIEHYRRALAAEPDFQQLQNNWGLALAAEGRNEEALEHYRKALEIDPGYTVSRINMGRAYAALGDGARAEEALRRALSESPRDLLALNSLGAVLAQAGRRGEAAALFRRSLELDPGQEEARRNLGIVEGRSVSAPVLPSKVRDGIAAARRGRLDEARAFFEAALAERPGDAVARTDLGNVYALKKDWERARAEYEKAVRSDPKYANARIQLGGALKALGRDAEAAREYRRALELEPNHPELLRLLETLPR